MKSTEIKVALVTGQTFVVDDGRTQYLVYPVSSI